MKRIKAINGYTIYETTKRDERDGHTAGEYFIYFSSDIRDFGREYSYPEFEGVGNLAEAVELCENNFALAKEACEEETTAATFEEIEAKAAELDAEAAKDTRNADTIKAVSPCCLIRFNTKTGKIDTTITGNGYGHLQLWALQNTTRTKSTVIFETRGGLIISAYRGTPGGFPEVREGKNGENIEDLAPGLLQAVKQ